jgi:hypothetical protein
MIFKYVYRKNDFAIQLLMQHQFNNFNMNFKMFTPRALTYAQPDEP